MTKVYNIDFRSVLGDAQEAMDNFETALQDLDGYFSDLARLTRGLPHDVEWLRSDFDKGHEEIERVHSRIYDDFNKYDEYDEDEKMSEVNWAFGLSGGTWALVSVVLPTETVQDKKDNESSLKKLCMPFFERLKRDHEELRDAEFIALKEVNQLDEEEEDAA